MQKGFYFNASAGVRTEANVILAKEGLQIFAEGREVFWPHRKISRSHAGIPGRLILKYGDTFRPDTLDLDEHTFLLELRRNRLRVGYAPQSGSSVVVKIMLWLLFFCLLLLGLLIAAWLFFMPKITELVAQKVPRSTEQKLAKPMLKSFLAGEKIDSAKTVLVNRFYNEHSIAVEIPVNITVVQNDVVNAFAIPGGELVVYTGLLDKLQHPGQLAALLGHEAGHVQHRHSLISLLRNLSGHLVLVLLLQDAGGIIAVLAERAEWLQQLAYSRDLELEADAFGLATLQANGYPPQHMATLMQVLKDANPSHGVPDFLSTHPAAEERILQSKEWAKKHPQVSEIQPPDSAQFFWRQLKAK